MNSSLLKKALPHIIAIAVFLIVAIIYCKPALDGKVVSQSDVVGWKGMAQQSFEYKEKYGHFPLWTESAFSGMPAYTIAMEATSKISSGYLSYLLTLNMPQPINFFFLACICFYILTQVMRINPWIGIAGSIAYAYSTFDPVIIAVGHNTQMLAIGYAPGVVASLLLIFQRKYLLGAALLSIFFGFQISTQHLQIVYYTVFILGFISLFYFIESWKQKELKNFFTGVAIAIVAGAIGFGTFAVSMLPLQEYAKETKRGAKSDLANNVGDKNKTIGGFDKDYAFQWSYGIGETFTLIVPGIYGGGSEGRLLSENSKFVEKAAEIGMPEDNALQYANVSAYWGTQPNTAGPVYLGAVICFLFIFGLVYVKSWHKWWILCAAVLGIVLAWGNNFSAFNYFMFDHFPFYNKFRAPTQALFFPQLVFPLLAVLGLNELLSSKEPKEIIWKKFNLSVYITAGILALLVAFYFTANFKSEKDARLKESFANQIIQSSSRGKQPTPEIQQQATQISNGLIKGLQADRQTIFGTDLIRTIKLIAFAAILIGRYLQVRIKKTTYVIGLIVLSIYGLALLKGAFLDGQNTLDSNLLFLRIFVLISIGVGWGNLYFQKINIKKTRLIVGLILLSSFDLIAEGRKYLNEDNFIEPNDFESAFTPTPANIEISKDPDKNFRVLDDAEGGWYQDAHASYHHNSIGGYSPAKLGLYQDILDSQLLKENLMVYNMLNTKYFIQRNPATGQPQARLNPNAFGSCWLVKNIKYVNNGNEEMKALDSVNVRDTAIVDRKFESVIKFLPMPDSTASIKLVDNKNDVVDYKFSSKTNQFAVFSEVYYDKGWSVFLDGNKTPYCKTDYILRGMPVPAGEHNIEFRFEPEIYRLGNAVSVWASIIVYLLLIAAIAVEWRNRNKSV